MANLKSVPIEPGLDAYHKALAWFFAHPAEEFTLNGVQKAVKISKTTARITVKRLVAEKFLSVKRLGKLWRISANQQHIYFTTKKVAFNLGLVYESGIVNAILQQVPEARAIILFGSYRRGDDVPGSDLDIAVEVLGHAELGVAELGTIRQFGYRNNVKVELHVFSRHKVDLNVFTNISNGIVLYGLLEARP